MPSLELVENASPTFWLVDFSLCEIRRLMSIETMAEDMKREKRHTAGCREDAAESALPLNLSPKCSVVDFSESGYRRGYASATLFITG